MRGRTLYHISKPVLLLCAGILRLLPAGLSTLGLTLARYVPTPLGVALRYVYVKRLAAACGDNVAIMEGVHLFNVRKMRLGSNVSIHPMCYVNAAGGLTIADNTGIGHACTVLTDAHDFSHPDLLFRDAPMVPAPVTIGGNVHVGAGSRVLAGVTIGDNVLIGASTVVTKDLPSNTVVVGVPARVIKTLPPRDPATGHVLATTERAEAH